MLPRRHRVTSGADYREVVRRGRRASAGVVTCHALRRDPATTTVRFGFIVTKAVGSAVTRNTVRRRLKAITSEMAASVPDGYDLVFRAHPSAASASFGDLRSATHHSVKKSVVA